MHTRSLATVAALALGLALSTSTPARSDVTSIKDVIMGGVPTSIMAKDLTSDWRTFSLNQGSSVMSPFPLGGGSQYYTKGEHIKIGNDTFLIAYCTHVDNVERMRIGQFGNAMHKDSVLNLALVNLSVVDGMVDLQQVDPNSLKSAPAPSTVGIAMPQSTEIITTESTPDETITAVSPHHTADDDRLVMLWNVVYKYVGNHTGQLPPMKSPAAAKAALRHLVLTPSVFTQVDTSLPYLPNANLSGKIWGNIGHIDQVILFYTQKPDMCGCRHALFADGEAHEILPGDWKQAKKFNHLP